MVSVPGTRCRSIRTIVSRGGVVRCGSRGTIVWHGENLGRELLTVAFEGGETLVVFPHEIELQGATLVA